MSNIKPFRIQVYPSRSVHAALRHYAEQRGLTQSRAAAELIEAALKHAELQREKEALLTEVRVVTRLASQSLAAAEAAAARGLDESAAARLRQQLLLRAERRENDAREFVSPDAEGGAAYASDS